MQDKDTREAQTFAQWLIKPDRVYSVASEQLAREAWQAALSTLPTMTEGEIVELLASMLFHRDARRDGGLTTWQDKTTTGLHAITAFNPELAKKYRDDAKDMMPELIARLPQIVTPTQEA